MPMVDFPLLTVSDNRSVVVASGTHKDQHLINCIPELVHAGETKEGDAVTKYRVRPRPGISEYKSMSSVGGVWRGITTWKGSLVSVVGANILLNNSLTPIGTLLSTTGDVYFTPTQGTNGVLILSDGSNLYAITTTYDVYLIAGGGTTYTDWAATTAYSLTDRRKPTVANGFFYEVTTAGTSGGAEPTWPTTLGNTVSDGTVSWTCTGYYTTLPTSHGPGVAFLDGYVTIMTSNAEIFHSDVNDPYTWGALNFLTAEMEPDDGTRVIKYNNYLMAFGEWTYQVYYDAANATGSIYAGVQGASNYIGCPSPKTVTTVGTSLMWVGRDKQGGLGVYMMNGLDPKQIAPTWLIRYLNSVDDATNAQNIIGSIANIKGHSMYVLSIPGVPITVAYDLIEKLWVEFQSYTGTADATFKYSEFVYSGGTQYAVNRTDRRVDKFDESVGTDLGEVRRVYVYTDTFDGGTGSVKHMHSLELVCDRQATSDYVFVSYSDDDWATESTARQLYIHRRHILTRFGIFTKRAFKFLYIGANDPRFELIRLNVTSSQKLVAGVK